MTYKEGLEMKNTRKKTMWMMTLVIAALCAIAAAAPLTAGAAERPHPGHKPIDVDIYKVPASEQADHGQEAKKKRKASLPSKYDPRNADWFQEIYPGDQGDTGLCWAFAATKLARISYAKEYFDDDPDALLDWDPVDEPPYIDLSPVQLGYFLYNRLDDPLGLTPDDYNYSEDPWYDEGGNMIMTTQHMATWSGLTPVFESPEDLLIDNLPYLEPDDYMAYDDNALIQHSSVYYESLPNDANGRNTIKSLVRDYGGAQVSIEYGEDFFAEGDEINFYNCDFDVDNHEVVIVGWNDKYSRYNFQSTDRWGNEYEPRCDGAWIVMNSYGEERNQDGYMYISYDSVDVYDGGILTLDMQESLYNVSNYQYDGNANPDDVWMYRGEKAANIYRAPADQQLGVTDFTFTTFNEGATDYRVDVYTGLTNLNNPASGIHICSDTVRTYTAGVKTFELPQMVAVDEGETFSVVITCLQTTSMGVESEYETNYGGYTAGLDPHQSFYYDVKSRRWVDAYNEGFCFRIKAQAINDQYCFHTYEAGETIAPTKSARGYTIYYCMDCGHAMRADYTPMKSPTPNKIKLKKVTKGKKCMTVKWGKSSEIIRSKHVTGYQIRYSLKKSMKKAKKVTCKGWTKTSKKIKKLKSGKRYYVQVRAYLKYGGKTYYSAWSNKKSVKTR